MNEFIGGAFKSHVLYNKVIDIDIVWIEVLLTILIVLVAFVLFGLGFFIVLFRI